MRGEATHYNPAANPNITLPANRYYQDYTVVTNAPKAPRAHAIKWARLRPCYIIFPAIIAPNI